ncbi:MAG TPA: tetratricopeptide repeat protein [Puia sp.]|nr:tetratricopeptide repeat protein [Puia sp.]
MKHTPILLFFLIITGIAGRAQNYYEQGLKAYRNDSSEMISIVQLFTKAIENSQEPAKSYMYRGYVRGLIGQFSMAEKDLNMSFQLDSTSYMIYRYYGKLYIEEQDYPTALRYFDKAISLDGKQAVLYDERSGVKALMNDLQGSIADASRSILLDSTDSDPYITRGFVQYELKNYADALKDLGRSIVLEPGHKGYADRGAVYYELKEYQRSIDDFTHALSFFATDYEVLYRRALAYKALGMQEKACADLKKSKELGYAPAGEELGKHPCN